MANDNDCVTIKDKLDENATEAKKGEFRKKAQAKLEELAKTVGSEEEAYRKALPGLLETWGKQDEAIRELEKQIKTCYPDWCHLIKDPICEEVIEPLDAKRKQIADVVGEREKDLDSANEIYHEASAQLDAWQTISKWIKAQLDANQKLIDEVCRLDALKERNERLCLIYIFFFELLPAHRRLRDSPDKVDDVFLDPEGELCADCNYHSSKPHIKLVGFPWVIDPLKYECKLTEVWEKWKEAGEYQVVKQCEFDQIAAWRAELASAEDPMQKRQDACAALRDFTGEHPQDCDKYSSDD